MSRHLHHQHHRRSAFLPSIPDLPNLQDPPQFPLRQFFDASIAHSRSILKRTPPGVSGSSSGDSSAGGSTSDSSSSSGSSSSSSSSSSSGSGSSDSSSSGGFGVGDGWGEKKPAASNHHGLNISIPVALAVVIPVLLAVVLFFFLHRRHLKKLKQEDANDPHKSLDFGWDPSANAATNKKRGRGKKGKPDMAVNDLGMEKSGRKDRGLSMDMNLGSPYIIPGGLHGSRESLNSMSRTMQNHDDRYRPAASGFPNDTSSLRSHATKFGRDDASISNRSPSAANRDGQDEMKQDLLRNSQRMSRSTPLTPQPPIPEIQEPAATKDVARKPLPSQAAPVTDLGLAPTNQTLDSRDSYQPNEHVRKSNNYLGAFIHSRDPSMDPQSPQSSVGEFVTPRESPLPPSSELPATNEHRSPVSTLNVPGDQSRPPRQQSLQSSQHASIEQAMYEEGSDYSDAVRVTPASPASSQEYYTNNRGSSQEYMPPIDEHAFTMDQGELGYDVHRLSMGLRPLPPDDPSDNPEQRANRIRSFYKEYFDDSKPDPSGANYYEDYDEGYLGDGAIFDPVSGQYVMAPPQHYAEPYGRRAMTPPPRVGGRQRGPSMSSGSHLAPPRARAFSTASGQRGPRRPPPKKKLPPPSPLRALPTPHMLKEDAFALPIDFAPAATARDRRAGVPDSPRGGARPYSPAVRAHTPLARSYDDLAVMPSPHLLRRSGTFTALDFAPPPRFKNSESGSDAGSIRSNRSGVSSRTQHAVRAGAYRVSRIPKEMVGSKVDLQEALKPSWNLHNNTSTTGLTL